MDYLHRIVGRTLVFVIKDQAGAIVADAGTAIARSPDGWAGVQFTVPSGWSGTHQIAVSFAGDDSYQPANATATLSVSPWIGVRAALERNAPGGMRHGGLGPRAHRVLPQPSVSLYLSWQPPPTAAELPRGWPPFPLAPAVTQAG